MPKKQGKPLPVKAKPASKTANQALVSIGLPCYHARIPGIRNALDDMLAQTHTNWELHISDNASPYPELAEVCKEYAKKDARIHYHRQPRNTGLDNFKLLVDMAPKGDYFMWIADDDRWAPTFLETCLGMLENNPQAALAYPNMELINLKGEVIGNHGDYARYTHGPSRLKALAKYVEEPEVMGKPNFLYGLFRRAPLVEAMTFWRPRQMEKMFGDIVFLFALQARHPIVCGGPVLVQKGVPTNVKEWRVRTPVYQTFHFSGWWSYTRRLLEVCPTLTDKAMVLAIMLLRLVHKALIALPLKLWDKLTGNPGVLFKGYPKS